MFPLKSKRSWKWVRVRVRVDRKTGSREKRVSGKRKRATTKEMAVLIAPSQ
jgi:hypothetical protein